MIFNNERDPILITICNKDGHSLLVLLSVCGLAEDPLLFDSVKRERRSSPDSYYWIIKE
jgi:hypothetical protein